MKNIKKILILILLGTFVCNSQLFCFEYKIETDDVLLVTVYDEPDLETRSRVDANGNIYLPLIGRIHVAGLAVNDAKQSIEILLELDYLINPHVNIFIEEFHLRQITVMGAVESPGKYDLYRDKPTSFLEAISLAGGFKQSAAINSSKVMRKTNGKNLNISVKVSEITKKGKKDKDIEIQPDDVIFVPDSFF